MSSRVVTLILWTLVGGVACAAGQAQEALSPGANALCPVMTDQPVKAERFIDYQGRRIYFCCEKCPARFKAQPAKYLANLPGTAATAAMEPTNATTQPAAVARPSLWKAALELTGKLHVVVVHFPIALLLVAGLIELFRLTKRQPSQVAYICLLLGATASVVAAAMGWINAAHSDFAGSSLRTLAIHRWLGVSVAAASVIAATLAVASLKRQKPALVRVYRAAAILCAVWVGVTGHFGGTLTYGDDYYAAVFRPSPLPSPRVPPISTPSEMQTLMFGSTDDVRMARIKLRLALVPTPAEPPKVAGPVFNAIDNFIIAKWESGGLSEAKAPPDVCDDATFCRRVYLDLIGVIPTIEEAKKFTEDKSPDKRPKLIDALLARSDAYAAHWTPFFEEAIASTPFAVQGGIPTHGNYQEWIVESFKLNRPWDLMVAQLIDPTEPGYIKKPVAKVVDVPVKAQYVRNENHVATLQTAANVGQFFLGTEMKCASCHSHFLNDEWPQDRFLAFAGLFASKDLELIRCEKTSGKIIPAHFAFAIPQAPADVPKSEEARLHLAVRLITDPANPRFAKTAVNRLWKRYIGLGLFEPADDWRDDSPPANPQLLDWLAYDFVEHGYDIKHTIRLILTSRTYQLRYDPLLADHFDLAKRNEPRYYRSPALRRLTAEQLIDSIRVAGNQRLEDSTRLYHAIESTTLSRSLGRSSVRHEISTARPEDVAVVQSLELLNGQEWSSLIAGSAIISELAREKEEAKVVDRVFRAALSRAPTEQELQTAAAFLKASPKPPATTKPATEEVVWLDDEFPPGAQPGGSAGAASWKWVSKPEPVFSGSKSHVQETDDQVQHFIIGATPLVLESGDDVLYTYVYVAPNQAPKEIMIQWNDGSWEHRATWGKKGLIQIGVAGTPSRMRIGNMPKPGQWARLEVTAKQIGLSKGSKIVGISFDQLGGKAYWDKSGFIKKPVPDVPALHDMLWALFTSPEFQYVR